MAEDRRMDSNTLFTRREILGIPGAAVAAGLASGAVADAAEKRPRIACVVTYWAAPGSHADWIINKLLDGYWWQGAHTPSRVDVVSVYIHQINESGLGRKVCEAKGIPIFDTVQGALTLGGKELAVDGVVQVGEHGNYHTNIKGQTYYPRWWLYQQIVRVFEQSKRSVPVFNDKHLSTMWDEARWMYDKSRELGFPLYGGSSIPFCYREPEMEFDLDTPIKASVVTSFDGKEAYGFHALDTLQCFAERRKGGETGIASVQCIEGPEAWKWTDRNPWAGRLLEEALKTYPDRTPGNVRDAVRQPMVFIIEYRDGTRSAVYQLNGAGIEQWAYAGDIEKRKEPAVIHPWFNFRPYGQYHAANAFIHWITEMMVTGKEPYPAERLLLTTGMLSSLMDSNWENGRHHDIGRRIETPFMDMTYRATREPLFNRGPRPPVIPYIRGFEK
jgi:hypothetical protein